MAQLFAGLDVQLVSGEHLVRLVRASFPLAPPIVVTYIYIYIHAYTYMYIYMYIYIYDIS